MEDSEIGVRLPAGILVFPTVPKPCHRPIQPSVELETWTLCPGREATFFLPFALQPTVGFGLSNNVLPFFPFCHQLSPSSHSQHLKISLYFLFPSFPGSSPSSRPFQFLSEDLFGHPISSILSRWPNQFILCPFIHFTIFVKLLHRLRMSEAMPSLLYSSARLRAELSTMPNSALPNTLQKTDVEITSWPRWLGTETSNKHQQRRTSGRNA